MTVKISRKGKGLLLMILWSVFLQNMKYFLQCLPVWDFKYQAKTIGERSIYHILFGGHSCKGDSQVVCCWLCLSENTAAIDYCPSHNLLGNLLLQVHLLHKDLDLILSQNSRTWYSTSGISMLKYLTVMP